jgi:hypothetical protein
MSTEDLVTRVSAAFALQQCMRRKEGTGAVGKVEGGLANLVEELRESRGKEEGGKREEGRGKREGTGREEGGRDEGRVKKEEGGRGREEGGGRDYFLLPVSAYRI